MTRHWQAEQVTDVCTYHGEGVCWDAAADRLRFVDLLAGALMTFDPAGGEVTRTPLGTIAAAVRPRRDGGLVLARERDVVLLDGDLRVERILPPLWDDPGVRFNDGTCDPSGRFWMGTMAYAATPGAGTLFRIAPDGGVAVALTDVTISNGMHFGADGASAYYVDTPTGRVDVLAVDPVSGEVTGRRPFVTVGRAAGHPDGMTVDAQGGVWVALWGGSAAHRYGPDGVLTDVVTLPCSQVSCVAFGGPDLADLYVTTSREGLPDDAQPLAGALFRVRPAVTGLVPFAFAG